MALRTIVKNGDPVLKKKSRLVTKFDQRLAELLDDMAETMMDGNGLGLAAPQVGVLRRVFIALDESGMQQAEPVIREFVNPEIIETSGEVRGYEGCLSFPGEYAAIARPERAVVKAFDRNGNEFTFEGTGMMARCLCHETNHLDGITIEDLAEYFYDPDVPHDLDVELKNAPEEPEIPIE